MKTSDIKKEAKNIINTIFTAVIKSDNKEDWKKAIVYIDDKITDLEISTRGEEMFIWRGVKNQITFLFGKKFINK